jgi:hypothetical protein
MAAAICLMATWLSYRPGATVVEPFLCPWLNGNRSNRGFQERNVAARCLALPAPGVLYWDRVSRQIY